MRNISRRQMAVSRLKKKKKERERERESAQVCSTFRHIATSPWVKKSTNTRFPDGLLCN